MLLGIITPTAGVFRLFGKRGATEILAARQRIGATLEYPNFYPYLSCRDNLRLVARVKGKGNRDVEEALEVVGLTQRQKTRFKACSLGMKQRLAIGATLLGDPELIVLDEPANGLDPAGQQEIRDVIRGLGERGKTIFLSSHILHDVEISARCASRLSTARSSGWSSRTTFRWQLVQSSAPWAEPRKRSPSTLRERVSPLVRFFSRLSSSWHSKHSWASSVRP